MYFIPRLLTNRNIRHGISTSESGNMSFEHGEKEKVIENRKKFLDEIRIPTERTVFLDVQHGTKIIQATNGLAGVGFYSQATAIKADGIVTKEKNLALLVLTADCIPAIFCDQENEVLGLAHISRHNTQMGFSQIFVSFLKREYRTNIQELRIFFAPSISKESYILPEYPNGYDLVGENINQLLLKGIREENIVADPTNTARTYEFFSHYRSVRGGEREGRFATAAMLV